MPAFRPWIASLAGWLTEAGADRGLAEEIAQANTARHALELLRSRNKLLLVEEVGRRLTASVMKRSGKGTAAWVRIIDFDNANLYSSPEDGGEA
jgi:cobalamin biosynthesis protein CbiD